MTTPLFYHFNLLHLVIDLIQGKTVSNGDKDNDRTN